jgi:flagellar hook capping protein FlgD
VKSALHWALLAGAGLSLLAPAGAHAQVIHEYTYSAPHGDASGAVAMGDSLMFVNNNEDSVLRLYLRYPGLACDTVVYSINVKASLAFSGSDTTADLEAMVKMADSSGVRIYWLGSMSNSASGNLRPNRSRVFATQVIGDGTGTPPYTLGYIGRYDHLREDIIAWDVTNLHGLGANYFGLAASAANNVNPKATNGYNVEGLTLAPDGHTAYIGFRTPFVNCCGPTIAGSARTHALIVPLLNMPDLVKGKPTPGPGAAHFGAPIVLALGTRGIRSIDFTYPGQYLITAGPADNVSNPPVAPLNFRLFTWTGDPLGPPPLEHAVTFAGTYSPEGCILPNTRITASTVAQFINDDGNNLCWRTITCAIGGAADPLDVPPPVRASGVRFSRPPAPNPARHGISFVITVPRAQWVDLSIHDVEGRLLATLWRGELAEGEHDFSWSGVAQQGGRGPAGLYWARLRAADVKEARPFMLTP